ncbi:uncharacterized protein LJ206_002137 isoform 3-T3 [Theristicus caerulescens]
MHLEDIVANIFAQILAVVDANNNLDLISQSSPLAELWLQMFQEETFLKIKYTGKAADAKIPVLSMTEDPNTSLFCQFPFSWVLKAYLDDVWEKVYHMKDQPEKPTEEVAKFYQTFIKNCLMPDGSKPDLLRYYANDFLRMAFPGQDLAVYEILSKVFLASAERLCSSVGRGEMGFSPIWLHMDYFYLRDDYQLFADIAKSNDAVISELQAMYEKNPPEMFVTLDALNVLLNKVQPSENGLLPFDACVAWLKSVKSIKPWVEWISQDNYQLQFYQKKKQLLDAVLFNNVKVHLEEYLAQMEEKISNQSNMDHFYFMVVHCLEDFMYPSAEEDVSQLAENCLCTADLSAFCKPEVSRINTLQFIAQLRLSISHVATVLGKQRLSAADPNAPAAEGNEKEQGLVNAMKKLVAKAPTPWPQVFLIRNLCDIYGLASMWKILQLEKWILPQGVEISQDRSTWSNTTLMFALLDKAESQLKSKDSTENQSLASVMGQMENILRSPSTPDELLEDKLKKIMDALSNREDPGLLEVVCHTALTLALSPSRVTHLLKNICFKPDVVKGSYLPTMPGDLLFDEKNWKINPTDKMWNESVALSVLPEKKDREEWETSFKALAQPFFQELEQSLNSVKEQRMNEGPQGSSLLLKIAYGQTPPFQDLPRQGLINQPCMWRFEQKTTIQTLMHFLQQEDRGGTGNPYPILLELLSKLENIQHVRHLPDIFRLQNALIHFFKNIHKGENYTVRQFLDQPELSEDQRLAFSRAIETIRKVWSNIKMNSSSSGITVLPNLSPNDINTDTAILHLLPTEPSISHLVTSFLIQLQNSCVDTAARVTRERQRSISAEEAKPSSVLAITKSDLVTMALTNLQYEIDEDGTKTTYFDFQMLQRQVVHRFISGKPIIKAQTAPSITLNNVRTLQATKKKVRDQLPQELLSINQQKRIMEEARSVNALSKVLATLKVAAEFLAVTGGDPERPLPEYVRQELRMDAGAKQFQDVPVVPNTRLKHILSLWQVLAARRSMLLVQMNQDPFCLVPKEFQGQLDAREAKALSSTLSNTNLDLFLIELHEMIMVALPRFEPEHELKYAFEFFLEDNQVPATSVATLTDALNPDIPVKNILSVWRTAAKTSQINVPAYGQGTPAQGSC